MSRKLAEAQARLVADLRDDRVPSGFDAPGVLATAAVLKRKRAREDRRRAPAPNALLLRRLLSWFQRIAR